jgi:hypothetical protein
MEAETERKGYHDEPVSGNATFTLELPLPIPSYIRTVSVMIFRGKFYLTVVLLVLTIDK